MKTILLLASLLGGCAAQQPWWTVLEAPANVSAQNYNPQMSCVQFVTRLETIRPGYIEDHKIQADTVEKRLLLWWFIAGIDADLARLKQRPDCQVQP